MDVAVWMEESCQARLGVGTGRVGGTRGLGRQGSSESVGMKRQARREREGMTPCGPWVPLDGRLWAGRVVCPRRASSLAWGRTDPFPSSCQPVPVRRAIRFEIREVDAQALRWSGAQR